MKEKISKIWKDSVWSKIIAFLIIGFLTTIYNLIDSLINDKKFNESFIDFWNNEIELWKTLTSVVIILLFYYIFKKFNNKKTGKFVYDEDSYDIDKNLYLEIKNDLIPQSEINWLSTHNFGGYSFEMSHLECYQKILIRQQDADFEYLNPILESKKIELIEVIRDFDMFINGKVFNAGQMRLTVPPEWELDFPERFNSAVDGIHSRIQKLKNKYDEFVKINRKILKV